MWRPLSEQRWASDPTWRLLSICSSFSHSWMRPSLSCILTIKSQVKRRLLCHRTLAGCTTSAIYLYILPNMRELWQLSRLPYFLMVSCTRSLLEKRRRGKQPRDHMNAYPWCPRVHKCLSLVYTGAPNSSQTACKRFVYQMRVCVDRTTNLHCAIRKWKFVSFLGEHKENWMRRVSFARLRFAEN